MTKQRSSWQAANILMACPLLATSLAELFEMWNGRTLVAWICTAFFFPLFVLGISEQHWTWLFIWEEKIRTLSQDFAKQFQWLYGWVKIIWDPWQELGIGAQFGGKWAPIDSYFWCKAFQFCEDTRLAHGPVHGSSLHLQSRYFLHDVRVVRLPRHGARAQALIQTVRFYCLGNRCDTSRNPSMFAAFEVLPVQLELESHVRQTGKQRRARDWLLWVGFQCILHKCCCQMISYLSKMSESMRKGLVACLCGCFFLRVVPLDYMNRQRSQRKVFSLKSWRRTQQSTVLCSTVSAGQSCEKCSINFKDWLQYNPFHWGICLTSQRSPWRKEDCGKLIQYQVSCQMLQVALSQNRSSRESYKWCLQERLSRWIWTSLWRRGAILQNIWRW